MKIIAVYPGRFQPFHKGHAQVYRWLKSKFGNAHIATSNKVELPKSPFTYEEKKRMMILAGVNASDITEVRNPYLAPEILKNYDGSKTVLVFAVSQKDMDEDPRFTFKPTKTGKASYLQPYKEGANLKPFGDPDKPIGYVAVTPTFNFDVLGEPMKSATEVRKQFANTDFNTQKEIIKDLFGSYDKSIHTLMNKKLKIAQTSVSKIRAKAKTIKEESLDDIGELDHEKFGPMLDSFVQFASKKLGIKSMPQLQLQKQEMTTSFGGYNPQNQSIVVVSRNRHPMDIFRTVAHELVHHKQKEDGKIGKNISLEGSTGSPQENEANAEAGKIMRWFAKSNPEAFKSGYVVEGMTTSGGIRGLGNVTGEVSPTVDSQYVLDNLGYQHPQLQDNTTKGLYSFSDDNWWMDKDGSKKYRMKSGPKTVLKEGLYDPVRGVAIIGGGPPGSGKDYLGKKLVLPHGFREINSDNAFEHLMRKGGLDPKMPDYQEPQRNRARGRAKEIYSEQERLHLANRNGVFVNGTADDPAKIAMIKKRLEDLGYKTMMMMTHVRDNVSKQRNIERGEQGGRTVPENIRREKWERVQKAKPYYRDMFGPENYVEIDNNDDYRKMTPERAAEIEATHNSIFKSIRKFASTPPENPQINAWRTKEMQRRGITQTPQQPRSFNMTTPVSKSVRMVKEETGSLSLKNWFDKSKSKGGKKGWVQVGGRYEGEPCARQPGQTSTPKCRSSSEAASMTKKEKQYAFKKKQREDPNQPSKSGASRPTMVKTYKNQEESVQMDKKTLQEIKDACYHKVKSRYKVWPSAYASGALVKCRKKGASNWGNKSKVDEAFETFFEEHGAGDFGTDKLRMNYQLATPGQAPAVGKKKKKLAQEDNNLPRYGLPADGIGPEATQYRPMTVSGFGGAWTAGISESVMNWANNPQTQQKYINKYGDLAEQKLTETVCKLNEMKSRESISAKRTISKLKEAASYGKDPADTMSMIGIQNKDEVREDQNLVHRKYKVKKKLAEQEQSEDAIETSSSIKGYKKNVHPQSTFEKKSLDEESFGPIYHKTTSDISSFKDFDLSKASSSAVLGPAVYATFGDSTWNPSELKSGKVLKGHVKGEIIDMTQPAKREHLDRFSSLLGRNIDALPLVSLEKRYGSVANGLKAAGFSAAIHMGPGKAGKHIAVFDPSNIVDHQEKTKIDEQEQSEDAIETSSSIKGYKKNIHPMSTFEKKSLAEAKPSFGAAFKAARERGETEFSWGKGKFGTLKKGETADQYKSYIASKKAVQPTTPAAPAVTAEPKTTSVVQKPVEQPVKPATAKAATPLKSVGGNTPGDVQPKRNEFTPNPQAFTAERDPENRPLGGELLSGTSETPRSMGKQPETGKFRSGTGKLGSSTPKDIDEESPAWTRSAGKNPEGGLNKKGIASYRAANPGSKLSLAVTTPPSKLKPGSKKAKRRLSFCRRMKGMKSKLTSAKTARDPDSRINKSLRKWNCEE